MTTNDDETTVGLSRRRMLQAVAAVGTAGAVGGVGTAAVLGDSENVRALLTSGRFDLRVSCADRNDEQCSVRGNRVVVDVDDLRPGDSGSTTLEVELDDNPGWLWLGGPCPSGDLGGVLEVEVALCETDDCAASTPILSGTLNEVLTRLTEGVRVGDDCIPGDEPRYLRLDWSFPGDVKNPHRFSDETASFELALYATQCRHDDGASYPGPRRDCDDPDPEPEYYGISFVAVFGDDGDGCRYLGKLELDDVPDGLAEGGRYALTADDSATGYELVVTETISKPGDADETIAVAFAVEHTDGSAPDLCQVIVKGGSATTTYTPTGENEVDNPCTNGGSCLTYGTDSLSGNATTEPLYAPAKGGDN